MILVVMAGCESTGNTSHHGHVHGAGAAGLVHVHESDDSGDLATEDPAETGTHSVDATDRAVTHAALHDTTHDPESYCTCTHAWATNGWCRRCGHGFLAGMTIESGPLFEALDTHGHGLGENTSFPCATCREARASDGLCDIHQWGFVNETLYATAVSWALARGRVIDADALVGVDHGADGGWCDRCNTGQIGATRFASHSHYLQAMHQRERLMQALQTLNRCEQCAIRTFSGGVCRACGTDSHDLPGSRYFEESGQTDDLDPDPDIASTKSLSREAGQ